MQVKRELRSEDGIFAGQTFQQQVVDIYNEGNISIDVSLTFGQIADYGNSACVYHNICRDSDLELHRLCTRFNLVLQLQFEPALWGGALECRPVGMGLILV